MKRVLTVGLFTMLGVAAHEAGANGLSVPAAACAPASANDAARAFLSNAGWVHTATSTGTINFYCPVSNAQNATFPGGDTYVLNVLYRDSDGVGPNYRVTARLLYRNNAGLYSASGAMDSNAYGDTGNTTRSVALTPNEAPQPGRLYSVLVTVTRTSTSAQPAFLGIEISRVIS
jgi:hypothetical protein